jgi:hypothetical protein
VRPDQILKYLRDVVALGLGAWGFINEMLKDKPEALFLILFFGMVLLPMPFAFMAMRTQGVPDPAGAIPPPSSGSQPPSPQPSSPSTS